MKNIAFKALMTLALTTSLLAGIAFADPPVSGGIGYPDDGNGGASGSIGNYDPNQGDLIEIPYYTRLTGENGLQIRNILGIHGNYFYGRRVAFIKLRASTDQGKGRASLAVNHQQAGAGQVVGVYPRDYYFNPGPNARLDYNVESMVLRTSGNFNIESIGILVLPPGM